MMKIFVDESGLVTIEQAYPFVYSFDQKLGDDSDIGSDHATIAQWLSDNREHISTYMVIVEAERLADEHFDDPAYLHKTNILCVSEAAYEARKAMTNKWFHNEDFAKIFKKHELHIWKYNYKDQPEGERRFECEVEDAVLQYQELREVVLLMHDYLTDAKYKLDDEGYAIQDDDDNYVLEDDEKQIEKNKNRLLERFLMPTMRTENDRVYAMPEPLNHWDYRSFWHQFFFIENHKTKETLWSRGQGGGSASRESNGRWSHTFAQLEKVHGIRTPTWHLIYDPHNKLRLHAQYDSFKSLRFDLTGNYHFDHQKSDELFEGFIIDPKYNFEW